jgi:hypothetical protein
MWLSDGAREAAGVNRVALTVSVPLAGKATPHAELQQLII